MKPEIETFQTPFELEQLVTIFDYHGPAKTLEVGCWDGGTLWHWLQGSDTVVAIDDRMRRADDWRQWALEAETNLYLIQGYSAQANVVGAAGEHAPYDFLFIDADHSYDSVRRDWDNYSPMVNSGGIIALHDIIERPGYGVSQLWAELKSVPGTRWMEVCQTVEPTNETRHGIGVIFT